MIINTKWASVFSLRQILWHVNKFKSFKFTKTYIKVDYILII